MYERCNNVVEMLTVITEGNMVSWERIGANEYKVPVARNFVTLEYMKPEGSQDSPLMVLRLLSEQGSLLDEFSFKHGVKGYRELKRLYDAAKASLGE